MSAAAAPCTHTTVLLAEAVEALVHRRDGCYVDGTFGRGGHAREDYKDRDDTNWMKHTLAWIGQDGKTTIDYRPVHNYTMTNDVQYIPPKARVY